MCCFLLFFESPEPHPDLAQTGSINTVFVVPRETVNPWNSWADLSPVQQEVNVFGGIFQFSLDKDKL